MHGCAFISNKNFFHVEVHMKLCFPTYLQQFDRIYELSDAIIRNLFEQFISSCQKWCINLSKFNIRMLIYYRSPCRYLNNRLYLCIYYNIQMDYKYDIETIIMVLFWETITFFFFYSNVILTLQYSLGQKRTILIRALSVR